VVSIGECNQPKGIKLEIRQWKLRSGVSWQGTLKQKSVPQTGIKQELGVYVNVCEHVTQIYQKL
jgi:hypothetical protein